jgi:phage shock protein C
MHKRLYRSARERMLGGVAAGIAEYFDVDPTIVRLVFVLTVLVGGAGVLAYIIMWIVIPQRPFVPNNMNYNIPPQTAGESASTGTVGGSTETTPNEASSANQASSETQGAGNDPVSEFQEKMKKQKEKRGVTFGIILVILGIFLLADSMLPQIRFHDIFPIAIMAAGVIILLNAIYK